MNIFYKTKLLNLLFFVLSFTYSVSAQTDGKKKLKTGINLEETISASENHTYTVDLENGMAIIGEVIQEGIDLVIDVYKPNGQHLKQIDSPNGVNGSEPIDITSNQSGKYKFVIHSLDKDSKKGKYSIKVEQIMSLEDNTKRITKKELQTETLYNLWESSLIDHNAIDEFVSNHNEKHIIELIDGNDSDMLVTYFCVPNENTEYVMLSGGPDFLGLRFQRLINTKLFFVTQLVPKDARFNYGFNYFNLNKAGPNGEIQSREIEHSYDGTLEMPNAPKQPYTIVKDDVVKGKVSELTVSSSFLNEKRKITVYTPAGYNGKTPHNLLIVFDGETYGGGTARNSSVPTPTILDNLIAENKITPTIAVLVWNMENRSEDLMSTDFANFIAKELIPWAGIKYNIHPKADKIVLAGSSRGGFASSFIAFNHSDVVGNVLSQSGSYWIKGTKDENHWIYPEDNGKLINSYKNSKKLPVKFYMDIGLYDAGASMLGMNRQFRDILDLKGYEVDYHEFKGGHNYVNWRGTLSAGLISLIGTKKE